MNFIDQVYVFLVYVGSELYRYIHIITGVALAMTISFLKAGKDGKKQNWGENILCGIFAGIALTGTTVIQFFVTLWFNNLPEGMVIPTSLLVGIVSGVIAWHGTDGTVKLIRELRSSKAKTGEDFEDDH